MRDQRFSKHTLIEICPFEEKDPQQEFLAILHPILPPKQDFSTFNAQFDGIEELQK